MKRTRKFQPYARAHCIALVLLLAVVGILRPIPAKADAVSDWSTIAYTAIVVNAARPAPAANIDFAYVHVAIYDAVNASDGRYSVFAVTPATSPAGASQEAATAAAAYMILKGLFPTQQVFLDSTYSIYIGNIPDSSAKSRGIAVGTEVALAFLALRANDGRNASVPYVFGSGPGVYQITPGAPPPPATPLTPWIAEMRPFAVLSPSQFRADGPPNLTSAQWVEDFNEVQAYGALSASPRSAEQTEIGRFYLENPGAQMNRNIRLFAAAQGLGLADNARLFAQVYVTIADSLITCWNSKFYFNFWRPVTAIRAADTDGNDRTQPDATWLPLAPTPNHPEYPAAHGSLTGALAYALEDFFGTKKITVALTSTSVPGVAMAQHTFTRTQDLVKEIIDARIYGGMHYRTSGVHGTVIAKKVAKWVSKHYFRPIR